MVQYDEVTQDYLLLPYYNLLCCDFKKRFLNCSQKIFEDCDYQDWLLIGLVVVFLCRTKRAIRMHEVETSHNF